MYIYRYSIQCQLLLYLDSKEINIGLVSRHLARKDIQDLSKQLRLGIDLWLPLLWLVNHYNNVNNQVYIVTIG